MHKIKFIKSILLIRPMVIINIDTKNDSVDDLRKTIRYLQSLIGEEENAASYGQPSASSSPSSSSSSSSSVQPEPMGDFAGMMSIFGDDASSPSVDGPQPEEKSPKKKGEAESLLEESERVEVEDNDDAFIEIVEYD